MNQFVYKLFYLKELGANLAGQENLPNLEEDLKSVNKGEKDLNLSIDEKSTCKLSLLNEIQQLLERLAESQKSMQTIYKSYVEQQREKIEVLKKVDIGVQRLYDVFKDSR